MSKLKTLHDLLVAEVKDLYSAETQLLKALPKMAKAANEPTLKEGFKKHLEQTEGHVQRLEKAAQLLDATPRGKTCKAMKGLIEEGAETIEEEGLPSLKDLALITAAQKVEHYEISGYGSVRALSEALDLPEVTALFEATLKEEGDTDKTLTKLAEKILATVEVETEA